MAAEDDELLLRLGRALAPEEREPDPARIAALRAAAERARLDGSPRDLRRRPSRPTLALLGAAATVAVAAAIALVATQVGDGGADQRAGGVVEFETTLESGTTGATAEVTGIRTGIGRVLELRSDELPILPKGEFYEVWFVGPGDTPGAPNRISAGTFHPDDQGRSDIELTAAVDPTRYPGLSVTEEPGDGDPGPSGVEVLRAPIEVTD